MAEEMYRVGTGQMFNLIDNAIIMLMSIEDKDIVDRYIEHQKIFWGMIISDKDDLDGFIRFIKEGAGK